MVGFLLVGAAYAFAPATHLGVARTCPAVHRIDMRMPREHASSMPMYRNDERHYEEEYEPNWVQMVMPWLNPYEERMRMSPQEEERMIRQDEARERMRSEDERRMRMSPAEDARMLLQDERRMRSRDMRGAYRHPSQMMDPRFEGMDDPGMMWMSPADEARMRARAKGKSGGRPDFTHESSPGPRMESRRGMHPQHPQMHPYPEPPMRMSPVDEIRMRARAAANAGGRPDFTHESSPGPRANNFIMPQAADRYAQGHGHRERSRSRGAIGPKGWGDAHRRAAYDSKHGRNQFNFDEEDDFHFQAEAEATLDPLAVRVGGPRPGGPPRQQRAYVQPPPQMREEDLSPAAEARRRARQSGGNKRTRFAYTAESQMEVERKFHESGGNMGNDHMQMHWGQL